jgi:uncharacterized membrane protein
METANDRMRELAIKLMQRDISELNADERGILESISCRTTVSRDMTAQASQTYWEWLADRVAAIGGSWAFIFSFMATLVAWMLLNSEILARWNLAFDPYPYIFLNLMLSMLAAIQAPVILMSQNRQANRDRIAAQHDYEVNLKSELEIMALHEKWDSVAFRALGTEVAEINGKIDRLYAMLAEKNDKG